MILNVRPAGRLKGCIHLPASKSYSIRAFLIAACGGISNIQHASDCEDARAALKAAKALGVSVRREGQSWHLKASRVTVKSKIFSVGESGTTLRFLLPLLPLHAHRAIVGGKGTLVGRPNAPLCQTLRQCGMDIRGAGVGESVPIVFKGGRLKGGLIKIDGGLSSQFISALLIALPRLGEDSRVVITGKTMVSKDYIVMTKTILAQAGIEIEQISPREYAVQGHQQFKGLKNFDVPSDYGLAAFAMAAGALVPADVLLKGNLPEDLIQADGHILALMRRMGAAFRKTDQTIAVRGPFHLKGGVFSLKNCPDLVPIMAVLALFAKGRTKLTDIHHARAKESDRVSDLRRELLKIGAKVSETANALIIDPQGAYKSGQLLDSHHDHRLAMAFTVLGLKIGCRVKGIESCRKSYPGFVRDIKALGALTLR